MAKQLFTNNATSTISGPLAQGGTTLICASGEGSNFPAPTGSDFFLLTIFEQDISSNEEFIEVVKVTARTADTMTIVRDIESMTGNAGGYAYPSVPAKTVFLELRWTAMGAGNLLQETDTGTPTTKGKELLTAADAAAVRTAAALGDSATKNVGTGAGTVAAGDHTHAGYATTGANTYTGDQTLGAGAKLIFEGTTDNAYETTVDPGDPTADRTLTLPNESGTFALRGANTFTGQQTIQALLSLDHASAGQIKFPASQNASTDANTLDDYEEGTWTPAFALATPGTSSFTYNTQSGTYVKIGKIVAVTGLLNCSASSAGTGSGQLLITGLPFASGSGQAVMSVGYAYYWTTNAPEVGLTNSASIALYYKASATSHASITQVNIGGAILLYFSLVYVAAT